MGKTLIIVESPAKCKKMNLSSDRTLEDDLKLTEEILISEVG